MILFAVGLNLDFVLCVGCYLWALYLLAELLLWVWLFCCISLFVLLVVLLWGFDCCVYLYNYIVRWL